MCGTATRKQLVAVAEELISFFEIKRRYLDTAILNESIEPSAFRFEKPRRSDVAILGQIRSKDAVHGSLAGVKRFAMRSEGTDEAPRCRRGITQRIECPLPIKSIERRCNGSRAHAADDRSRMEPFALQAAADAGDAAAAKPRHDFETCDECIEGKGVGCANLLCHRNCGGPARTSRMAGA
ncbi:hypothetical protein D3C73_868330 [compost metagenome]